MNTTALEGNSHISPLLTNIAYEDLQAGRLRQILSDYRTGEHGLYVLYPSTRFLPLKTRLFIDFFVERFARPLWLEKHDGSVRSPSTVGPPGRPGASENKRGYASRI